MMLQINLRTNMNELYKRIEQDHKLKSINFTAFGKVYTMCTEGKVRDKRKLDIIIESTNVDGVESYVFSKTFTVKNREIKKEIVIKKIDLFKKFFNLTKPVDKLVTKNGNQLILSNLVGHKWVGKREKSIKKETISELYRKVCNV